MVTLNWATDFNFRIIVTERNIDVDLTSQSINVYAFCYKSMNKGEIYKIKLDSLVSNKNEILVYFPGKVQKYPGIYSFCVIQNEGQNNLKTGILKNAIYLQSTLGHVSPADVASEVEIALNINENLFDLSIDSTTPQGLSAYEVATSHGYQGTELEWLDSLNGKSLYDYYVDQKLFSGNESEFIDWYKKQLEVSQDLNSIYSTDPVILAYEDGTFIKVSTLKTTQHLINDVTKLKEDVSILDTLTETVTKLDERSIQPVDIVADVTSTSIKLTWAGYGDYYYVYSSSVDKTAMVTKKEIIFNDLKPDTEYRFKLCSVKGSTYSDWSELYVKTKSDINIWYRVTSFDVIDNTNNITLFDKLEDIKISSENEGYLYILCKNPITVKLYDYIGELVNWDTNASSSNIPDYHVYRSDNQSTYFTISKIIIK